MRTTTLTSLLTRSAFALALVLYVSAPVSAAIMYGDFDDIPPGVVMYTDVTESSVTDPVPPPRYGPPTAIVNELDFDTLNFGAVASDGAPSADITDGQLNFGFMVIQDNGLSNLAISESGDFSLIGTGTSTTSVAAGIFAEIEISHINHVQLPNPITIVGSTQFSTDLVSSPGLNQPWGQTLLVDFGPALLNAGFDPDVDFATKGEVVINNTLAAISEVDPSTIAFIAKKDFKIIPGGDLDPFIPEPTSVALAALGMIGVLASRRAY